MNNNKNIRKGFMEFKYLLFVLNLENLSFNEKNKKTAIKDRK